MGIKEWAQRRIEKDAVMSEIGGEKVILKKSKLPLIGGEWKQIHPPIDENGRTNWINLIFGGRNNFLALVFVLVVVGMALYQYFGVLDYITALQEHACYPAFSECVKNLRR